MVDTPIPHFSYVVIGGGIAGVTCVDTLCQLHPESSIALITASSHVKRIRNLQRITRLLEEFTINEQSCLDASNDWSAKGCDVHLFQRQLHEIDILNKRVSVFSTSNEALQWISYEKLCLCLGASPRLLETEDCQEYVLGLRDVESVDYFQQRLKDCRRVVLVGNGGIATELAYVINNCEIIWAIRDNNISTTFLDESAASFILNEWRESQKEQAEHENASSTSLQSREASNTVHETVEDESVSPPRYDSHGRAYEVHSVRGSALGPHWARERKFFGSIAADSVLWKDKLQIEYCVEVVEIVKGVNSSPSHNLLEVDSHWPVYVKLNNGKVYGCDLVISAIGVIPIVPSILQHSQDNSLKFVIQPSSIRGSQDGGILVDEQMRCFISTEMTHEKQLTKCQDVYAAGDCCSVNWKVLQFGLDCPHWFQMRLWSQARQMGFRAACCMQAHLTRNENEELPLDFCFELFTHVTRFFGRKVILLGRYNAQGLSLYSTSQDEGNDMHGDGVLNDGDRTLMQNNDKEGPNYEGQCELLLRMSRGGDYVKCVMLNGRMQGCALIGDSDLEETMENLILNQLDLTAFGDDLLNPDIDIEDYFD